MEDEEYFYSAPIKIPQEILGLKKFYTDEFDAFEKYYEEILASEYDMYFVHLADRLPLVPYCELATVIARHPKKEEQNEEPGDLPEVNDSIEFAHPHLKLVESKDKGRHLITTAKLEEGDVVINEKITVLQVDPLCSCFQGDNKMYRCHHCAYAVTKFYTCSSCNIVVYCSVKCLVKSYNEYHRFECEALQRHLWKIEDTNVRYIAFRMMLYGALHNFNHELPENNQTKWGSKQNNYPYIYRLQSHFNELPVKKVYEILRDAAQVVVYLVVRTTFFREFQIDERIKLLKYVGGLIVRHHCQALVNSILMRYPNFDVDYAFNTIGCTGKAICPTIALLNHACSPNATLIPYNDRILVKMLKSVQPNTEITICYQEINTFFDIKDRQILMEDYFYFERLCDCSYCTYESTWQEHPYKCHKCVKGKARKVAISNGKKYKLICKDCNAHTDFDMKAERSAVIANNLYRATFEIDPILRILESYDKLYPWDSWMLLDIYRILCDKYMGWEEKPIETIKYGIMYFNILEQYLPRLFEPCLEARMKFFYAVANTDSFRALENVTATEFDTIKYFIDDCLKTKKDITFYIPKRFLEFYYIGLLSKLEAVQFNLKIVR